MDGCLIIQGEVLDLMVLTDIRVLGSIVVPVYFLSYFQWGFISLCIQAFHRGGLEGSQG